MTVITKTVPLFHEISSSRANSAYQTLTFIVPWLYTAGNYDGTVQVFFEAVLAVTGGSETAYAALYTAAGSVVTGSEVSTTSATPVRVRSGDILANLADGTEYRARNKSTSASTTCTVYSVRLVIVQTGTITKTETVFDFGASASMADVAYATDIIKTQAYLWDASQFDGTVAVYFEAMLSNNNGSATTYAQLAKSDGTDVTGSEVTNVGGTDTRARSADIAGNLVDDTLYMVEAKVSSNTGRIRHCRLVITQSGSPTKTESYYQIETSNRPNFTTTQIVANGFVYWDTAEWSVTSYAVYHESHFNGGGGNTGNADLNDASSDVNTLTSTSSTIERQRSADLSGTLVDNTEYDAQYRMSAGSGGDAWASHLIVQATFGGAASSDVTGIAQSPGVGSGADQSVWSETATGSAPGSAAGADQTVFAEQGAAQAPAVGSGTDQSVFAEQGAASSPASAAGADQSVWAEQAAAESPAAASGADQSVWAETGAGQSPAVGSGADQAVFADAGVATSPAVASGADQAVWVETGLGASPGEFSGTSQLITPTDADTGAARSPAVGSGADQSVWVETAAGQGGAAADGADQAVWAEQAAASSSAAGSGISQLLVGGQPQGGGMGSWVPHWSLYTDLDMTKVSHGEPLGPPTTERERRLRAEALQAQERREEEALTELLMTI
jgi:hypothetical protein